MKKNVYRTPVFEMEIFVAEDILTLSETSLFNLDNANDATIAWVSWADKT